MLFRSKGFTFYPNGELTVRKLAAEVPACKASITDLFDTKALAAAVANCDILVNATRVGMEPLDGQSLIDPALFRSDLVVMCAGIGDINATLDYAVERPTIDTNVVGWTYVIDMLYCLLEQQGFGHLVAITSAGGLRGEPMAPAYSATKAYQINYMEALRKKAFKSTEIGRRSV